VRIAVEAAVRDSWSAFLNPDDTFIGMKSFGASGPFEELYSHFGITPEAVVAATEEKLRGMR
jgi:transketolase